MDVRTAYEKQIEYLNKGIPPNQEEIYKIVIKNALDEEDMNLKMKIFKNYPEEPKRYILNKIDNLLINVEFCKKASLCLNIEHLEYTEITYKKKE